jgi:hypothetical protein
MAAKQSAKGAAATVATGTTFKNPFSGGSIAPVREFDNLAETDSNRDRGVSFTTTSGVEGSPEFYVRDASLGLWLLGALGADAVTGSTNFTHTITPANTLPYMTMWRNVANTLYEQYRDCKISTLVIGASAGQPLTATATVQGLQASRLASDPSASPAIPLASQYVYNYNDATVTLGGGATALVSSFELTIENNVTRQQTDDFTPYDVVEGTREIDLTFDLIFEDLTEYNKFHYGGVSGTSISASIYTTTADFQFDNGANNQVKFSLPSIAYQELPVDPDPGGAPITTSIRAVAQRGASPVITAVVKNQVSTY